MIAISNMLDFSDHDIWRLALTVGMNGFNAAFFNRKTREFVPYISRVWECADADVLKNVENAVYDDSLLPDDYDTSILIRPKASLIVPRKLFSPEDPENIRTALDVVDASEQKDVWFDATGDEEAFIFSTPRGLKDFLSRTFLTEDVHHVCTPLTTWCGEKAAAEGGEKMWVHLSDNVVDIAAFRNGRLVHSGFWYCSQGADTVYYILFFWKALSFNPKQGELRISGKEDLRRQVLSPLRKHINYVSLTVNSTAVANAINNGINISTALNIIK
ncbi:MAG: DUF3822 family protein [Prevotella sp.]|nr:DUF3822 family protein [Prevotella sp.]MCM1074816.1 DUF3822 family protein [Ruminococcus sp.]